MKDSSRVAMGSQLTGKPGKLNPCIGFGNFIMFETIVKEQKQLNIMLIKVFNFI
jgi:hypothetical protein